ncbi:hypothetical protein AB0I49_30650 [Streptomyces sp. NPDC050617]|uniref:hypothetical protein n=1 Tax=Streptomyces sp. NPDC050617 TaxID=3154628 RepID=UPI00343B8EBE
MPTDPTQPARAAVSRHDLTVEAVLAGRYALLVPAGEIDADAAPTLGRALVRCLDCGCAGDPR